MRTHVRLLLLALLCASGIAAETNDPADPEVLSKLLNRFRGSHDAELPDTFRVRIQLFGYLTRDVNGRLEHVRPDDIYEFTPSEVSRLRPKLLGADEDGPKYARDAKDQIVYEVAAKHSFEQIDDVCRNLLALDFLELVKAREGGDNLNYLDVMKGAGLPAMGDSYITVSVDGKEFSYGECCQFGSGASSVQSIKFAALYHNLRRLARTGLGLAKNDWNDAVWWAPATPPGLPAKWTFDAGAPKGFNLIDGHFGTNSLTKKGLLSFDAPSIIMLPISVPKRPFVATAKLKQAQKAGAQEAGFEWFKESADGSAPPPHREWGHSKLHPSEQTIAVSTYFLGKYTISVQGDSIIGISCYEEAFPSGTITIKGGRIDLESIEVHELKPDEIPEKIRDPEAIFKKHDHREKEDF